MNWRHIAFIGVMLVSLNLAAVAADVEGVCRDPIHWLRGDPATRQIDNKWVHVIKRLQCVEQPVSLQRNTRVHCDFECVYGAHGRAVHVRTTISHALNGKYEASSTVHKLGICEDKRCFIDKCEFFYRHYNLQQQCASAYQN